MKNNQNSDSFDYVKAMLKHGGRRSGAGRKKGSYTSSKTLKKVVEAEARGILVKGGSQ